MGTRAQIERIERVLYIYFAYFFHIIFFSIFSNFFLFTSLYQTFVLGGLITLFHCSIPLARFASYHHTRELV
jgi:hypothetical protein